MAAIVPTLGDAQAAQGPPYWRSHGCEHGHRSSVAYKRLHGLLHHTRPVVDKRRVRHYATCVATRAKAHRAHELARRWWAWRHEYAQRWVIVFNRLPSYDRAWAVSTSQCESGMNPATNTGNGFYGAFQFVLSTWYAAGGTGNPAQHSWHFQAVVAVRWMHIAGASQWPVCGH